MPKRVECVITGCDAVFEAPTEPAVLAQVETHVSRDHPELSADSQLLDSIRARVEDS
ncbi:DUF1059 domain-containing protein [Haloarchaeobius sp. DFWS5]|uniref:DUF1059 domain-containing protein n=1 Tax=Haloarchaeobius sp. DFWS5 TaxID=3446114 RepID=UPI003EBE2D98